MIIKLWLSYCLLYNKILLFHYLETGNHWDGNRQSLVGAARDCQGAKTRKARAVFWYNLYHQHPVHSLYKPGSLWSLTLWNNGCVMHLHFNSFRKTLALDHQSLLKKKNRLSLHRFLPLRRCSAAMVLLSLTATEPATILRRTTSSSVCQASVTVLRPAQICLWRLLRDAWRKCKIYAKNATLKLNQLIPQKGWRELPR